MEGDVKIASGHGPAEVPCLLLIDYEGGERAIFPSTIFHTGKNCAFTRNTPPERGTALELAVPEKFERSLCTNLHSRTMSFTAKRQG